METPKSLTGTVRPFVWRPRFGAKSVLKEELKMRGRPV